MDYRKQIEKAIDYIEENLQCELTLADCACVSGYSPYHFLRIFRDVVGLTPADYIRKRRISEISKEIMQGNRYISSIAFRYGFNSKENFVRAFKMEHHILPTEYKNTQNSLKLYERFRFEAKDFSVIPRIEEIQPFFVTQIHRTWDYIRQWFSDSRYERRDAYEFECYCEKSRLFSEDIYIPVEQKQG